MKLFYATAFAILFSFTACNKETLQPAAPVVLESQNAVPGNEADAASVVLKYDGATGNYTLTLQPGKDGNDLWFKYWIDHPYYSDTCDTGVRLIKALTWQVENRLLITRSVIKFDSLIKVPATANILSATLYLYGPSPNSPDVDKHLPMGDSYYPGTPYQENTSFIQRITSSWDENTICWNNRPSTTTLDQTVLSPSTKQWEYNTTADVTKLVKPMISNASKNYGFMFKLQSENPYRSIAFFSSEYKVASSRPKLVIVYK